MEFQPERQDIPYEEEILKNPYSVKCWLRYLEHKSEASRKDRYTLYERALKELPGSFKLWKRYLGERITYMKGKILTDPGYESTNNCFERSVVFLHKMPRIWMMFCEFLMDQLKITRTRHTFDRALRALPITQHDRIWKIYLKFARTPGVPGKTAIRVYRRYLKLEPTHVEEYVEYLKEAGELDEAALQLATIVNDDKFASMFGKSSHQLWMELCELISQNPDKVTSLTVEPIIRNGLKAFTDAVGKLWTSLADYYIRLAQFEKARDIYEEGINAVSTVRDFSLIFDAYSQFEESMLTAKMQVQASVEGLEVEMEENEDIDVDLRFARFEALIERRPLLLNSVLLRQNPQNVHEWQKRAELYNEAGQLDKVVKTYTEALKTVDPFRAAGKIDRLWINFAKFYEENGDLTNARAIFERAHTAKYKKVESLANLWCGYAEMEIRHKKYKNALKIMQRATSAPGLRNVDYYDETLTAQQRLFKSTKLWAFYVDLEESLGTLESAKEVYNRVIELRVATPQIIVNFAHLMEEHKYFEESFKIYEKGVNIFKFPHSEPVWKAYLTKFVERYQGKKLERARDLYEQCLEVAPAKVAKQFYYGYAELEIKHGGASGARRAMSVYERATGKVPKAEALEVFEVYVKRCNEFFGATHTRSIYEKAIAELPDHGARKMTLAYADLERQLGEIDRARALYTHCSQFCNPKRDPKFWQVWGEFEQKHGNEDTFREMLHTRRSVAAHFATANEFLEEATEEGKAIHAAKEAGRGTKRKAGDETSVPGGEVAPGAEGVKFVKSKKALEEEQAATDANPEAIDLDDDEEDEEEDGDAGKDTVQLETKSVPAAVFGGVGAEDDVEGGEKIGALARFKKKKDKAE